MIEERIDTLIEMYQSQLNGASERLKEDIRALIKAEQDELHYYAEKKDYLSSLTKEINDTEQKVSMMKEFLGHLKWLASPYEKQTYKLTQFEYDLLQHFSVDFKFKEMGLLKEMKEKGHFKNINGDELIKDILESCEVIK